jgi:hypothetical protein
LNRNPKTLPDGRISLHRRSFQAHQLRASNFATIAAVCIEEPDVCINWVMIADVLRIFMVRLPAAAAAALTKL